MWETNLLNPYFCLRFWPYLHAYLGLNFYYKKFLFLALSMFVWGHFGVWGGLPPLRPCLALFLCHLFKLLGPPCFGLLTTETLRNFSGGNGVLRSLIGEGYPRSLCSWMLASFASCLSMFVKLVLATSQPILGLISAWHTTVLTWFCHLMHALYTCNVFLTN